jgi:peptide/nickel transport system substrate-binding protein
MSNRPKSTKPEHVAVQSVTAQTGVARMRSTKLRQAAGAESNALATDSEKTLQIAHKGVGAAAEHHHVAPVHPDIR